jgi:opacity protein-like surface antigen
VAEATAQDDQPKETPMSKFRTTLGVALLAFATSALPAAADLYVGFGSGRASIDEHVAGSTDELNADETSEQFFFGLELGRHAALEFGRTDFGVLEDTVTISGLPNQVMYTADGRTISMLFRDEITDDLSLFLRAGVVDWNTTTDIGGGAFIHHDSGQNGVFGFGATFRATDHLTFRAEYTQYEIGDADLMASSLAVVWGF